MRLKERQSVKKTGRRVMRIAFLLPVLLALLPISGALALEGAGSHYFGANEDFYMGSWPEPGLAFNFSTLSFTYGKLKGNRGQTIGVPGGYAVDGLSNSVRIQYTTKVNFLDGNLGWYVAPAVVYQHVSVGGKSQSKTSMADINFGGLVSYHSRTFHQYFGVDAYAPTGAYNKYDFNNVGLNYWSLGPMYSFTYLGDARSPIPGFEVSAKFMYYFHTTNTATGYTSGQEFCLDYLVGKHFGETGKLGLGVNGHYEYQTTDDSLRNAPPAFDGYKSRQFTVGGVANYWVGPGFITLKLIYGVYAVNHGEGSTVQIKYWLHW